MKIQFNMVIKGEDAIYEKFVKTLETHPTVQMDLIKSFGQTIMMAFRLEATDNVSIESFRAGRIQEEEQKPQENSVETAPVGVTQEGVQVSADSQTIASSP